MSNASLLTLVRYRQCLLFGLEEVHLPEAGHLQKPTLCIAMAFDSAITMDMQNLDTVRDQDSTYQDAPVTVERIAFGAHECYSDALTAGLDALNAFLEFF